MLWALQRMIFNRLDNPENQGLQDLTRRELAVLLPLLVGIIWLGLFPGPVLQRMEPATRRYVEAVQPHSSSPAARLVTVPLGAVPLGAVPLGAVPPAAKSKP